MYEIESRTLEAQPTLVVRGKLTVTDIKSFLGRAYHLVASRTEECGTHFAGPPFARYRALDPDFTEFEVEAGFPVITLVPCKGDVEPSELPAGQAATTVHIGPYDQLKRAYAALHTWIEERGGVPSDPPWEVYHTDPNEEPDHSKWRTEVVYPFA